MATGTVMPLPRFTLFDSNGNPVSGGLLYTYLAGTSTPASTYSDVTLLVANPNPLVMNSAGRPTVSSVEVGVYLTPGQSYKFVAQTSAGASIWTQDNVAAVPASGVNLDVNGTAGSAITAGNAVYLSDGSGGKTAGSWYPADSANTYSSVLPQVGMAPSAITLGATGTIRLAGQLTGLSGLTIGSNYFIGTAGAITSSAPANRRYLGVADTTSSMVFGDKPSASAEGSGTPANTNFLRGDYSWSPQWTVISTSSVGTQNNFAPGLVGNTLIRCNNASLLNITGLAGGYDGQRVVLVSIGAGQVDLPHQSGSSTAANQWFNTATTYQTSLAPGTGTAEYQYDGTTLRWRLLHHVQGASIDWTTSSTFVGWVSFTAGRKFVKYTMTGNLVAVQWHIEGTSNTTGATFTVPFTSDGSTSYPPYEGALGFAQDNGVTATTPGGWTLSPGASTVVLALTSAQVAASWTNAGTKIVTGTMVYSAL